MTLKNEMNKYYLPMQNKKEQWDRMTPEEKGIFLANRVVSVEIKNGI